MSSTVSSKTVLAAIVFDHSLTNSDDPLPKKVRQFSTDVCGWGLERWLSGKEYIVYCFSGGPEFNS